MADVTLLDLPVLTDVDNSDVIHTIDITDNLDKQTTSGFLAQFVLQESAFDIITNNTSPQWEQIKSDNVADQKRFFIETTSDRHRFGISNDADTSDKYFLEAVRSGNTLSETILRGDAITLAGPTSSTSLMTLSTLTTTGQTILARDGGQVLVGTSAAISTGSTSKITSVGDIGLLVSSNTSDDTDKFCRIAAAHYTNAEKPVGMIFCFSEDTRNILHIGGGSSVMNAATETRFFIGASTTTATGTEVGRIAPSTGNLLWGTSEDFGARAVFSGQSVGITVSDSDTDLSNKIGRIGTAHYDNSEEPVGIIHCFSDATRSIVNIGGGTSFMNTATEVRFYTASDNTTTGGTEVGRIADSTGNWLFNTTSDIGATIHCNGALRQTGTSAYWEFNADGRILTNNFAGTSYIRASSSSSGNLAFITNGRGVSTSNANLLLNSDQSVTVNTDLYVGDSLISAKSGTISITSEVMPSTATTSVFIGNNTGNASITGSTNVAVGASSANDLTTGDDNVFIGYLAGQNVTTGSNNVIIGENAGASVLNGSNNTIINNENTPNINTSVIIGPSTQITENARIAIGAGAFTEFHAKRFDSTFDIQDYAYDWLYAILTSNKALASGDRVSVMGSIGSYAIDYIQYSTAGSGQFLVYDKSGTNRQTIANGSSSVLSQGLAIGVMAR